MQRIIFRHLSGSKANQVEEFPADSSPELIFGRDDAAQIKYDPARDDLVSRQHAKIVRDPANAGAFILEDLGSRNGTFLNKQRLTGRAAISPGDMVQFGPGGPEFQFDLDPRPNVPARTREASVNTVSGPPATREGTSPSGGGYVPPSNPSVPPPTNEVKPTVGKATVERMVGETRKQGQKTTAFVGLGGLGLVALVGGLLFLKNQQSEKVVLSQLNAAQNQISERDTKLEEANTKATAQAEEQAANAPMTPRQIVDANSNAIVQIAAGWKITTTAGNQLYHQFVVDPAIKKEVAMYVLVGQKLEPLLTAKPNGHPIGAQIVGTGFAISNDGFILTNRHVASCWETAYQFPADAAQGYVQLPDGKMQVVPAPRDWVPSETKQQTGTLAAGFGGVNDYIRVTFPGQTRPNPAISAGTSPRHDAAMIKISTPGTVDKVELNDSYESIKPGDAAIVMGYPVVSPAVFGVVRSQDVFNQSSQIRQIYNPTVSVGNVGRVLRGDETARKSKDPTVSMFGDAYQLTINSTGGGNSGGPVFDEHGKVIAIYFAGASMAGANISFGVPIRYGIELMSPSSRRDIESSKSDDSSKSNDSKTNAGSDNKAADGAKTPAP